MCHFDVNGEMLDVGYTTETCSNHGDKSCQDCYSYIKRLGGTLVNGCEPTVCGTNNEIWNGKSGSQAACMGCFFLQNIESLYKVYSIIYSKVRLINYICHRCGF